MRGLSASSLLCFPKSRVANDTECDLTGIFFGIVDVLSVVPVASADVEAVDGDRSRPSSAPTCNFVSLHITRNGYQ